MNISDIWKWMIFSDPVSHKYIPQLDSMDETVPVMHVTPSSFVGSGLLAPIPFELMSPG